jgi:hypothetical protein
MHLQRAAAFERLEKGDTPMPPSGIDRRKEPRYPVKAYANVRKGEAGEVHHAQVVNASGGGVLLMVRSIHGLAVGDELICEVDLPQGLQAAIPHRGMGRVVRLDGIEAAVQYHAALG